MSSSYNHTGQVVTDLARAKRFYQEVFGFKFWYEFQPPEDLVAKLNGMQPPIGTTASYLTLDGFVLELIHYSAAGVTAPYRKRTMAEPGLTHLSLAVKDIEATCKKVREHGGEVLADSHIGVGIFVRDPEGQLVELLDIKLRETLPPRP